MALGIFAGTFMLFWPATRNGFVDLDDRVYVLENPLVQQGLTPVTARAALTTVHERANWIPLTLWSLQLDTTLWGRGPRGYHLTNVALHALNAVLVFVLLRRASGSSGLAAGAALLFAWHPLRVESVAWITERKDVLSAFWGLLAILIYLSYARRPAGWRMAGVAACMLLSLMAKPMLVTLPFLFLLLDAWPLGRLQGQTLAWRLLEKSPLWLLTVAFCLLTLHTQQAGGALRGVDSSLLERVLRLCANFAGYLRTTFVPVGLSIVYGASGETVAGAAWLGGLAILGMAGLAWHFRRRLPAVSVGLCWYLGLLVPVIGLIPVGAVDIADRYTYLPSVGLAWALAAWGCHAAAKRGHAGRALLFSIGVLAWLGLAGLTRAQIQVWRNSLALYENAVRVSPRHAVAQAGLGLALQNLGRTPEALAAYDHACRLDPHYVPAHVNRALLLVESGRPAEALTALEAIWPRIPPAWRAAALNTRAMARDHLGHTEEAMADLRAALELEPDLRETRLNLGLAYWKTGQLEPALAVFKQVAAAYPGDPEPWTLAGRLLAEQGRFEDAAMHFRTACQLDPASTSILPRLAEALAGSGQAEDAIATYRQAIRSGQSSAVVLQNLASLLSRADRQAEALDLYEDVLRQNPGYALARFNYGNALHDLGRFQEAEEQYREALRLDPLQTDFAVNRGRTLCALGRIEDGVAQFKQALEQHPEHVPASINLADALLQLGRKAEAAEIIARGLEKARETGIAAEAAAWEIRRARLP